MAADPRLARRQQAAARAASSAATAATPPPPPPPPAKSPTPQTSLPQSPIPPAQTSTPVNTLQQAEPAAEQNTSYKLKFCTVCASNNNRSMESHLKLSSSTNHYPVISFGTGSQVRLPGPTQYSPNVYNFNSTTYADMYSELANKDARLYTNNGILKMLARNRDIKSYPERWQDWRVGEPRFAGGHESDQGFNGTEGGVVDVVITCEERCWDVVVDDLLTRGAPLNKPVHIFNVDIKDSHEEALKGGRAILDLANSLNEAAVEERFGGKSTIGWENGKGEARQGFDDRVPEILGTWQERWSEFPALWTLAWF